MSRTTLNRVVLALAVLIIIAAFGLLDIDRYLTLSYVKQSHERFSDLYREHPFAVIAGYFFVYILLTSLALPGAGVFTKIEKGNGQWRFTIASAFWEEDPAA